MVCSVPVMRWKLLETHKRRMNLAMRDKGGADLMRLRWRDEYAVNI